MTLLWADNAIPNGNWLQVTVLANDHTGRGANDVFYLGCASSFRSLRGKGARRWVGLAGSDRR